MSFENEIAKEVGKKIILPILFAVAIGCLIGFALSSWFL